MKELSRTLAVLTLLILTGSYVALAPTIVRSTTAVTLSIKDGREVAIAMPDTITTKQQQLLNFAYEVARLDGYKKPQWLQGIIMQETKAGAMREWRVAGLQNKAEDRYFGIGQIKLIAAKGVMNKYPELWKHLDTKTDEELQARLVLDDEFNIRVASKYGLMMGINQDPSKAVTAYNQGPTGALDKDPQTWGYTQSVKQHVEKLKNVQLGDSKIKSQSTNTLASR